MSGRETQPPAPAPDPPASDPPASGLAGFFRRPFDDTLAALDAIAASPRPSLGMVAVAVSVLVTWFVYVPIHELLHVLGCVGTGGSVSELQLDPAYGAGLLSRVFPFVVEAEGDYSGRLSGFDTGGSDLVYLATVFAPYLLSVAGVALLRACAHRARPFVFGVAVVVALAPFYNVLGDYYEMGSILVTRVAALLGGADSPFLALRSDDLVKLVGTLAREPEALGLAGTGERVVAALLVGLGAVVSVLLAFATYAAGGALAGLLAPARAAQP